MARTKQTARKSTGGKAPRRQVPPQEINVELPESIATTLRDLNDAVVELDLSGAPQAFSPAASLVLSSSLSAVLQERERAIGSLQGEKAYDPYPSLGRATTTQWEESKEIDPTFIVGGPYGVRHILHLFYKLFGVGNNTWTASIFLECSEKMAWMVRFTQAINARMLLSRKFDFTRVPNEVLSSILEFACERDVEAVAKYGTGIDRHPSTLLQSTALVSRVWLPTSQTLLSQELIFSVVYVDEFEHLKTRWIKAVEQRRALGGADMITRRLTVDWRWDYSDWSSEELERLLHSTSGLRTLVISARQTMECETNVFGLSCLASLTDLQLSNININGSIESDVSFSFALMSLTLDRVKAPTSIFKLLFTFCSNTLINLSVDSHETLQLAVSIVGPKLRNLSSARFGSDEDDCDWLGQLSSLKTLQLSKLLPQDLPLFLNALPTSSTRLRLTVNLPDA